MKKAMKITFRTLRRTHKQIQMDILEILLFNRLSMRFTPLMQKGNIQGSKLKREHLPYLLKQGWIRKPTTAGIYELTINGINKYIEFKVNEEVLKDRCKR